MTDQQIEWAIISWQGGSSIVSEVNKANLDAAGIQLDETPEGIRWRRWNGAWNKSRGVQT